MVEAQLVQSSNNNLESKSVGCYFSKADIDRAHAIREREVIRNIDANSVFRAGVYCITLISERWQTAENVYGQLMRRGFTTPDTVTRNVGLLRRNLKGTRWPMKKYNFVQDFASWYVSSELPVEIMRDMSNGRDREFELRDRLVDSAPGMGPKSASLLMLKMGYENVVPVDVWECRFLIEQGHNIQVGDYIKVSGPKGKKYLEYESMIREFAKGQNMTPALFHFALWGRSVSWEDPKRHLRK